MSSRVPSTSATFIRGGTSKAVFFHEKDIPPPGPFRDEFLIRIMGSPDPNQIDGMGGTRIVTSKVAIVRKSTRDNADVDYTFAQIGLGESTVAYDANCGNISSGVGPFAINEGLLEDETWDEEGRRVVRIYNTGQEVILVAHVPVDKTTGRALEKGGYAISGCPGTGAPILMDYSKVAKTENLIPTGHVIDRLECTFGSVEATFCDVGNPIAFIDASCVDITGAETPVSIDNNSKLQGYVTEVRGKVAELWGKCNNWSKVDEQSPMLPMVALVSKPTSKEGHIQSRLILDHHCHQSMAGTGGICTTAASRITGSVVNRLLSADALACNTFEIQHPAGHLPISVAMQNDNGDNGLPVFTQLGFMRTARYLMQGQLFVPADIQAGWSTFTNVSGNRNTNVAGQASDEQAVDHPASTSIAETPHSGSDDTTKRLAEFTHQVSMSDLTPEAERRLRQCLLDHIGVGELGSKVAESSEHFLKGIKAVTSGFPESHTVMGMKKRFPAQYAALLNGAFAHSLDFDDTHTGGIIHVGVTIFAAVLTEAEDHADLTYEEVLVASAAGYEIACRVAIALGVTSWHRGFHNTSIAGIFGAVAAIAKLRQLAVQEIENAFGLAVSFASGSMQYLENGAWNKRLHPAKAAHDAFLVVALAQAGVLGAAKPIEGKFGLIAAHTDPPRSTVPIDGLRTRWEFINVGLKPYPACRVTHTSIELAATLAAENKSRLVKDIHIIMDPVCYPMVGIATPNKKHPNNVVDAQFSAFYQAAVAWLYGDNLGWAVYDHLQDSAVQQLCDHVTIEEKAMTNDLITTMTVTFEGGEMISRTLQRPKWQEPERPPQMEEVEKKFVSLATPVLGEENVEALIRFVTGTLDAKFQTLSQILFGNL